MQFSDHKHIYFSALKLAVSLERSLNPWLAASGSNNFLEPWQMVMHENTYMIPILYEPRREKIGFLHMQKQRRRSASR